MEIRRLIISPIMKGCQPIIRENPTPQAASILIKDKLSITYEQKVPKILKRLPKHLRGWVNPDTLVIKRNF